MKRITLFVLVGLLLTTVVGCGTLRGIGDDIATVGHWITRGSNKAATK
ncbi:MAG: entericidin EcnA/B family protein [Candidatus Omnitrophica bacterium]|nr:entericidin EcnA/B family protein [Candidatus Omnitrophota bacterium]